EQLALQVACVQQTLHPSIASPYIVIFAADHGIAHENVSAYPREVTAQMVLNFARGGAAINVFARQNTIGLRIVDAGVDYDFPSELDIVHAKIAHGTRNFLHEPAMTPEQCAQALECGSVIVQELHNTGCNAIGFGDMGIGNTTAASTLMHSITHIPLESCIGAGTGLTTQHIQHKRFVIASALARYNITAFSPEDILRHFGGFEIAMMCGAMLEAASRRMILVIDGFITTAALLVAHAVHPHILHYCIFAHESDEHGHTIMLRYLNVEPLLRLGMRLGEGTGAALAFPLIQASVNILNEMATFDSAHVSRYIL
ncbi:MAG: nicotinate-nucleotide--dimethylbenzimidazole phosphoribosyltransferase, partial [Bacteroidota bacterium]|nr:nicotinate-nucleotide--dimethylbenzimidazole phosphoribosyltransferase [Candidatus Kapabacteria bacterium]MDW8219885.1 nicotinate-nucleotide--dimethylbenzimidazole phosphoribosyltransferase [Bacteroidota bacterium]